MQRQVRNDHSHALGQRVDDRLPLAMGEPERVQQDDRRAGPGLAVRHARPVLMMVQSQLHAEPLPVQSAVQTIPLSVYLPVRSTVIIPLSVYLPVRSTVIITLSVYLDELPSHAELGIRLSYV